MDALILGFLGCEVNGNITLAFPFPLCQFGCPSPNPKRLRDLLQDGADEAVGKVQGDGSAVKQGQSSRRRNPDEPIEVCCSFGFVTATS